MSLSKASKTYILYVELVDCPLHFVLSLSDSKAEAESRRNSGCPGNGDAFFVREDSTKNSHTSLVHKELATQETFSEGDGSIAKEDGLYLGYSMVEEDHGENVSKLDLDRKGTSIREEASTGEKSNRQSVSLRDNDSGEERDSLRQVESHAKNLSSNETESAEANDSSEGDSEESTSGEDDSDEESDPNDDDDDRESKSSGDGDSCGENESSGPSDSDNENGSSEDSASTDDEETSSNNESSSVSEDSHTSPDSTEEESSSEEIDSEKDSQVTSTESSSAEHSSEDTDSENNDSTNEDDSLEDSAKTYVNCKESKNENECQDSSEVSDSEEESHTSEDSETSEKELTADSNGTSSQETDSLENSESKVENSTQKQKLTIHDVRRENALENCKSLLGDFTLEEQYSTEKSVITDDSNKERRYNSQMSSILETTEVDSPEESSSGTGKILSKEDSLEDNSSWDEMLVYSEELESEGNLRKNFKLSDEKQFINHSQNAICGRDLNDPLYKETYDKHAVVKSEEDRSKEINGMKLNSLEDQIDPTSLLGEESLGSLRSSFVKGKTLNTDTILKKVSFVEDLPEPDSSTVKEETLNADTVLKKVAFVEKLTEPDSSTVKEETLNADTILKKVSFVENLPEPDSSTVKEYEEGNVACEHVTDLFALDMVQECASLPTAIEQSKLNLKRNDHKADTKRAEDEYDIKDLDIIQESTNLPTVIEQAKLNLKRNDHKADTKRAEDQNDINKVERNQSGKGEHHQRIQQKIKNPLEDIDVDLILKEYHRKIEDGRKILLKHRREHEKLKNSRKDLKNQKVVKKEYENVQTLTQDRKITCRLSGSERIMAPKRNNPERKINFEDTVTGKLPLKLIPIIDFKKKNKAREESAKRAGKNTILTHIKSKTVQGLCKTDPENVGSLKILSKRNAVSEKSKNTNDTDSKRKKEKITSINKIHQAKKPNMENLQKNIRPVKNKDLDEREHTTGRKIKTGQDVWDKKESKVKNAEKDTKGKNALQIEVKSDRIPKNKKTIKKCDGNMNKDLTRKSGHGKESKSGLKCIRESPVFDEVPLGKKSKRRKCHHKKTSTEDETSHKSKSGQKCIKESPVFDEVPLKNKSEKRKCRHKKTSAKDETSRKNKSGQKCIKKSPVFNDVPLKNKSEGRKCHHKKTSTKDETSHKSIEFYVKITKRQNPPDEGKVHKLQVQDKKTKNCLSTLPVKDIGKKIVKNKKMKKESQEL